jgi:hypothetical protein
LKGVTAIHLVKRTNPGKNTTALRVIQSQEGKLYAYCSTCEGLAVIRPVFQCPKCKMEGTFERKSLEPIDHFDGDYQREQLVGICNQCKDSDVYPNVCFECASCDARDMAILRQIRDNIHDIPCMKCTLRKEILIQMRCSSKHCICLDCFKNMCKVKLDNDSFKNFEGFGYSVNCPGPSSDCSDVPILDPHHFKIVDDDPAKDPAFYKKFKDMSFDHYKPSGDDILCLCKKEITMSSARQVNVGSAPTPDPQPTVAGQKWYSSWVKLFKKKQEPAPPPSSKPKKMRRKASCSECSREYCMECKMVWHTGECCVVDDKTLQDQEFPIEADQARLARWPSSS